MAVAHVHDSRDPASAQCGSSPGAISKVSILRRGVARLLTIAVVMFCIVPGLATIVAGLTTALPPASAATGGSATAPGYWLVASDGGVFTYGDAAFYGSTGAMSLNKPIVAMAATPDGQGYWLVASDGGVFPYGDATFYGSTGGLRLKNPIVAITASPDGRGYWLVASDGGVFSFGDASFYGSTGGISLKKPIVAMTATPDGRGYWLVASDGGVFTYGDAAFYGSTGGGALNKPIVTMAATPDGRGYWLVASDGGVFTYGDAVFYGSTGGMDLNRPIVTMAATPDGRGYWLVASDGGVFTYGDAAFYGSAGGVDLNRPIVAMAASPANAGGASPATNTPSSAPTTTTTTNAPTIATTAPTTTTTTTTTTTVTSDGMTAPAGYTAQQKVFDDNFAVPDSTKWITKEGSGGQIWNNEGSLPAGYSGNNMPGGTGAAVFNASQLSYGPNGLTITAQQNTTGVQESNFPWISGMINSMGKFTLPTTGWYFQAKIKMPDMTTGMWPAFWFLPGLNNASQDELDGFEGGMTGGPSGPQNQISHYDYFSPSGPQAHMTNVGMDLSAGYHVYGVEWKPGPSGTIKYYIDNVLQATYSGNIPVQGYEMMINLQVASLAYPGISGWHTVPVAGQFPIHTMDVAEVQAYS